MVSYLFYFILLLMVAMLEINVVYSFSNIRIPIEIRHFTKRISFDYQYRRTNQLRLYNLPDPSYIAPPMATTHGNVSSVELIPTTASTVFTTTEVTKPNIPSRGFPSLIRKITQNFLKNLREGRNKSQSHGNIHEGVGDYSMRNHHKEWLVAELFLISSILLGVPSYLSSLIELFGYISLIYGAFSLISGIIEMQDQISPYIYPVSENKLVKTGIYDLVRHPIYGGWMMLAVGMAVRSKNVDKFFVAVILGLILNAKADQEEKLLIERHEEEYMNYMIGRRKMIPYLF